MHGFYFLYQKYRDGQNTTEIHPSFPLCGYILPSPLLTRTPHLATIFNLSSNKGDSSCSDSYRREIKVTLNQNALEEP